MKNVVVRENVISKRRYVDYGKNNIFKESFSKVILDEPYYNEITINGLEIDDYKNNLLFEGNIKIKYYLNNPVEASFQNNTYEILKSIIRSYLSFYFNNLFRYYDNVDEYDLYFYKFNMIHDLNKILNVYYSFIDIKDISLFNLTKKEECSTIDKKPGEFTFKRKKLKDEVLSDEYKLEKNNIKDNVINKDKSLIIYTPNDSKIYYKENNDEYIFKGSILYKVVNKDIYKDSDKEELKKYLSYTFDNLTKNLYSTKKYINNTMLIDAFIYENIIKHNNEEYNLILENYGIKITLIIIEDIEKNLSSKEFSRTLKK